MIRSFKDPRAERLFKGERVREFHLFARQADKRLRILDAADSLQALQMLPSKGYVRDTCKNRSQCA
jgi:toxin HigB-1